MAEEIDFENRRISNFKGLVVHHSSTSTYIPNFIGIGKLFVDGRTYVRMDGLTDGHETQQPTKSRHTLREQLKALQLLQLLQLQTDYSCSIHIIHITRLGINSQILTNFIEDMNVRKTMRKTHTVKNKRLYNSWVAQW